MKNIRFLGNHTILDLYACGTNLYHADFIEEVLTKAVEIGGGTLIKKEFHNFEPYGVSGFIIIAESHLSIHTWPEHNYAAVDIFTCGEMDIDAMEEYIIEQFKCEHPITFDHFRGIKRLL